MANQAEENFNRYKRVEGKALEILEALKAEGGQIEDIEIALVTAAFELHRGTLLPHHIGKIVKGHVDAITDFYTQSQAGSN